MGSRQPAYRGRVAARNERWREPGADNHGAAMPIARHETANSIDHSTKTITKTINQQKHLLIEGNLDGKNTHNWVSRWPGPTVGKVISRSRSPSCATCA